jgi:hypothetical protein
MRHIYKRFFSKIEELGNYVKKKRTDIGTMKWIRKRTKIGLYYGAICFNDIIYKIALCNVRATKIGKNSESKEIL